MIQKINRLIQNQTSSDIKNCGNVRTFTYLNSLFNGNKIKMKPIPKILTSILFLIIIFNLISHQPWSSALRQCWAQSDPCCCKKKKSGRNMKSWLKIRMISTQENGQTFSKWMYSMTVPVFRTCSRLVLLLFQNKCGNRSALVVNCQTDMMSFCLGPKSLNNPNHSKT